MSRKPEPIRPSALRLTRHPTREEAHPPKREEIDEIHVYKSSRELYLLHQGQVQRRYDVAFGPAYRDGHKRRQGDNRTPEGRYRIVSHNGGSKFHLSLKVSYPNADDRAGARKRGVSAGDWIMVHGLGPQRAWAGKDHSRADWTQGCIAVTNAEIEEIFAKVKDGTPITIFGVDVPALSGEAQRTRPQREQPKRRRSSTPPAKRGPIQESPFGNFDGGSDDADRALVDELFLGSDELPAIQEPVGAKSDAISQILGDIFGGGGGYEPQGPKPVLEAIETSPFGF